MDFRRISTMSTCLINRRLQDRASFRHVLINFQRNRFSRGVFHRILRTDVNNKQNLQINRRRVLYFIIPDSSLIT